MNENMTPEKRKFFNRVGRVNLGSEELTEETAAKLNQIIDDIDSGKDLGGLPPEWLAEDEKLKELWEEKFLPQTRRKKT